jgi:predicted RNase H-like HicB family nuclease
MLSRLLPIMPETLRFRMEYWKDGNWYVGRLPQVPGVFSQGATLRKLEENIRDAYRLMLEEQSSPDAIQVEIREIEVLTLSVAN